jgi:hypothetical protein
MRHFEINSFISSMKGSAYIDFAPHPRMRVFFLLKARIVITKAARFEALPLIETA